LFPSGKRGTCEAGGVCKTYTVHLTSYIPIPLDIHILPMLQYFRAYEKPNNSIGGGDGVAAVFFPLCSMGP
jgi:hypothetical protein